MSHPVVRWQIISPKPSETASFYQKLFGWEVDQANALGYREIKSDGIAGGVWPGPETERPFAQLFVSVPDVAAHVSLATDLGASVLVPVSTLPDGDVMAVMLDPVGLPFVVCSLARSHS